MPVTVLLVGNSRLHWGRGEAGTFQLMERWDGHWPPWSVHPGRLRWARVGRLPEPLQVVSNTWPAPISTPQVPLLDCPAAVGVDRALATWAAWQQSNTSTGTGTGTMVVDAGTALTITVVDRKGRFRGGRIVPGITLQLQSLHRHTASLPLVQPGTLTPYTPTAGSELSRETQAAMVDGVMHCLCAGVVSTVEALTSTGVIHNCWLTGGDAPLLQPSLEQAFQRWSLPLGVDAGLALAGLLRLAGCV